MIGYLKARSNPERNHQQWGNGSADLKVTEGLSVMLGSQNMSDGRQVVTTETLNATVTGFAGVPLADPLGAVVRVPLEVVSA